jgi:hypothetical protein
MPVFAIMFAPRVMLTGTRLVRRARDLPHYEATMREKLLTLNELDRLRAGAADGRMCAGTARLPRRR